MASITSSKPKSRDATNMEFRHRLLQLEKLVGQLTQDLQTCKKRLQVHNAAVKYLAEYVLHRFGFNLWLRIELEKVTGGYVDDEDPFERFKELDNPVLLEYLSAQRKYQAKESAAAEVDFQTTDECEALNRVDTPQFSSNALGPLGSSSMKRSLATEQYDGMEKIFKRVAIDGADDNLSRSIVEGKDATKSFVATNIVSQGSPSEIISQKISRINHNLVAAAHRSKPNPCVMNVYAINSTTSLPGPSKQSVAATDKVFEQESDSGASLPSPVVLMEGSTAAKSRDSSPAISHASVSGRSRCNSGASSPVINNFQHQSTTSVSREYQVSRSSPSNFMPPESGTPNDVCVNRGHSFAVPFLGSVPLRVVSPVNSQPISAAEFINRNVYNSMLPEARKVIIVPAPTPNIIEVDLSGDDEEPRLHQYVQMQKPTFEMCLHKAEVETVDILEEPDPSYIQESMLTISSDVGPSKLAACTSQQVPAIVFHSSDSSKRSQRVQIVYENDDSNIDIDYGGSDHEEDQITFNPVGKSAGKINLNRSKSKELLDKLYDKTKGSGNKSTMATAANSERSDDSCNSEMDLSTPSPTSTIRSGYSKESFSSQTSHDNTHGTISSSSLNRCAATTTLTSLSGRGNEMLASSSQTTEGPPFDSIPPTSLSGPPAKKKKPKRIRWNLGPHIDIIPFNLEWIFLMKKYQREIMPYKLFLKRPEMRQWFEYLPNIDPRESRYRCKLCCKYMIACDIPKRHVGPIESIEGHLKDTELENRHAIYSHIRKRTHKKVMECLVEAESQDLNYEIMPLAMNAMKDFHHKLEELDFDQDKRNT